MKSTFRSLTLVIMSLFGAIIFSPAVSALQPGDVVMSINPSSQDLELTPGETFRGSIEVANSGRLPFKVVANVRPFYIKDNNYDSPDFSADSAYTKLHNWVKLSETEFYLEPGAKHRLDFTVEVPADIASSGQYAAIMLLSDGGNSGTSGVSVSGQIAALLYGHVNGGELRAEGELTAHSMPNFIVDRNFKASHKDANGDIKSATAAFSLSQTVKNTGNVDFRVTQIMTITDFFTNREVVGPSSVSGDGQLIGSNSAVVLPGTSRTGILTWPDAPRLGLFTVTQTVRFLDQEHSFDSVVFLCPVWLIVIVMSLIIVFIIWLIIHLKRKSHHDEDNPVL